MTCNARLETQLMPEIDLAVARHCHRPRRRGFRPGRLADRDRDVLLNDTVADMALLAGPNHPTIHEGRRRRLVKNDQTRPSDFGSISARRATKGAQH